METVHDLLALAINSPQTDRLENTGAGIGRLDIYKHIIKIREVDYGMKIALVFDDKPSLTVPSSGNKYGQSRLSVFRFSGFI